MRRTFETAFAATTAAFNRTRQRHLDALSAGQLAPSRAELQREFVVAIRAQERSSTVSSVALQQAVAEADRLCRLARRGVGGWPRPRDTRRGASVHFTANALGGAARRFRVIGEGRDAVVMVPTMGPLRVHLHRSLPAAPTSMTVGRDAMGWWVSFVAEVPDPPAVVTGAIVGVDVGVAHRASWVRIEPDGKPSRGRIANPRIGRDAKAQLARLAARRDRFEVGSRRWREADRRLRREYQRVARRRLDHARKAAAEILAGARVVVVEGLDVRGLIRHGHAHPAAIRDAAMALLLRAIAERADATGVKVVRVPPAGTSMTCPACAARRSRRVPLSERTWTCASCGACLDRDWAAAATMVRLAREQIAPGAGEIGNALGELGLAEWNG